MRRCRSWAWKTSELCQALYTIIASAKTVQRDNCDRAWASVRVPNLQPYTRACRWYIESCERYNERVFAVLITCYKLSPDEPSNIKPAFDADLKENSETSEECSSHFRPVARSAVARRVADSGRLG